MLQTATIKPSSVVGKLDYDDARYGAVHTPVTAPDFMLSDSTHKPHRLSNRRGKFTVVYFYPKDDTPDCTIEAREFMALYTDFSDADTEIWGVSAQGAKSKDAFRTKYGLPFTLLSDEDRHVAMLYGALPEAGNPLGLDHGLESFFEGDPSAEALGYRRISFLVDPDGMIVRYWPKVQAEGHAKAVRLVLETEKRKWSAAHNQ